MIGVLVGDISSPFFGRFLKVVEKRVWERDYLMIVADTDGDPARELDLLEQFDSQRIAGILLSPHGGGVEYGQRLVPLFRQAPLGRGSGSPETQSSAGGGALLR
ncbi:LacI family transcriptional regulator (plasmid) [Rhizobium indicum]|uniref:LacI family transcriptional regulator n=1 Tax=Rhizobium indicum TaxID=2583231 RepID=UPI001106C944|nr:LacI family transcriptional regulator [Rhizobium indicum]QKK33230.1 LacI family transcriptional regulator [Rhizobium indicum]